MKFNVEKLIAIIEVNLSDTQYDSLEQKWDFGNKSESLQREGTCHDIIEEENTLNKTIKINLEKLKAIARPMSPEEQVALNFRNENEDWWYLSAIIAYKIRKILYDKRISKEEFANLNSVTEEQIKEWLSSKVSFDLKTIAKFQSVLGEPIIEVDLTGKTLNSEKTCSVAEKQDGGIEQSSISNPIETLEPDPSLEKYRGILYEGYLHD